MYIINEIILKFLYIIEQLERVEKLEKFIKNNAVLPDKHGIKITWCLYEN